MTSSPPRIGVIGIRGSWSTESLVESFEKRSAPCRLVEMEHVAIDTDRGRLLHGDLDLGTLDGLVIKKIGREYSPHLLDRLEMLRYISESGVRIFSDPHSVLRLIDRLSCTVTLRRAGIPMPPTFVTEDVDLAVETVRRFERAVLKPLYSTKARGMRVVEAGDMDLVRTAILEFQASDNPVLYIQKMLPVLERDLGIVFIDGECLGSYARVRGDSWNTTIHSGGRYERHSPSAETLDLARRAQELFGLDFGSVDVAETEDGPVVFEVSAFGGFRGLWEAQKINAAESLADHVLAGLGSP